ncbi:MFS transporter [Ruicaihuangia caeni]|uniref:MFS transporter n=1 Tax=Ruicaihuangia caeni TaxID=3042517 RepID=A0AAW6T3D5_9MICO|nr:MFS transporter [Klugiella sp. YN-L-19]MDI2098257.1 MFS transporter [Klugiella sp. YN-L-19]
MGERLPPTASLPSGESVLSEAERRRLTRRPSDRAMIAALTATGLLAAFMQTIIVPVLPRLPELLDTSVADSQWVLISTLLASAVSTPVSGRLGDMYGKRRMVLVLLAILVAGSLISALSFTLIPMLVGRVLQGISLGVIALSISVLRDVIHPKNLPGAVALVSATLGVGGAVGLPIAGVIAENFDWHVLFWAAALTGVALFVVVLWIIPVSTLRTAGRFDYLGAVGLMIGLTCLLLAVSKGADWGWTSAPTLALLVGGAVVLVGWAAYELRHPSPLVDLRVNSRRPVLFTNLSSITVGFAFFVTSATLPVLLEAPTVNGIGLGQPLLITALCLMPSGLMMFFVSPLAARLSTARGPKTSLVLGSTVIAFAFVLGALLITEVWHVLLVSTVMGIGVGFAYAAQPTLIMNSVPATETAAANGLNAVMRTLGSAVSATVVGLILAGSRIDTPHGPLPTEDAYRTVFVMGAAVVVVGILLALFIPRRTQAYQHTSSIPIIEAGGEADPRS